MQLSLVHITCGVVCVYLPLLERVIGFDNSMSLFFENITNFNIPWGFAIEAVPKWFLTCSIRSGLSPHQTWFYRITVCLRKTQDVENRASRDKSEMDMKTGMEIIK